MRFPRGWRLPAVAGLWFGGFVWTWAAPAQQPPDQTPSGQYPPNQAPYPPGQYPGNYPNRLPGGIPLPEIKLPKRQPKDKPGAAKITLASIEGGLRKLGEKELLLQRSRDVLRFRLLAKTQFRDRPGNPIRDSLLRPGDQISVQVSPDDEETAIRVVLLRRGNPSERAACERPIGDMEIRAPAPEDLGKPRSVSLEGPAAQEAEPEPGPMEPGPEVAEPTAPEPAAPAPRAGQDANPVSDDQVLDRAREAAAAYVASLPNFIVQQATSRYYSTSGPKQWRLMDIVNAELAYVDGKEEYRNVEVGGRPSSRPEQSGAWSTGDFAYTLEDLLSEATSAVFKRRGEEAIGARQALVYDFNVDQASSNWVVVAPDKRTYNPAYHGALWIDRQTGCVLRIEQRTGAMPPDFPVGRTESILEYAYVRIDGKVYLLPSRGENIGCASNSVACTRNVLEFRNYRKFTAESAVKF
ncbi:MAG: hypothetical protein KIT09_31200 [Bryobacteraceae bacterium]|nr:hypothetical protein [Bryobacteraceae bacterium]